MHKPVNSRLRRDRQPRDRVRIPRVVDQGRVDEAFKRWARAPAGGYLAKVGGQAPACIERRARCRDGQAPQQRLEPRERCHAPDLVNLCQERGRIRQAKGNIGARQFARSAAMPRQHVGVGLVDQNRVAGSVPA